jgi:hypothetical protein
MFSSAHLRASDADRERTASELAAHCAEGRLTQEELSERIEFVYRARTLGELAAVARDLPRVRPTAQVPPRVRARLRVWALVAVAVAALGGLGLLAIAVESPEIGLTLLILLVVLALVVAAVLIPVLVAAAPVLLIGAGAVWIARALAREREALGLPLHRTRRLL